MDEDLDALDVTILPMAFALGDVLTLVRRASDPRASFGVDCWKWP